MYSKVHPVTCTHTHHHDVTDLVILGMVKNTNTWNLENGTWLSYKINKFLTSASDDTLLKSYCLVAEVTFNPGRPDPGQKFLKKLKFLCSHLFVVPS